MSLHCVIILEFVTCKTHIQNCWLVHDVSNGKREIVQITRPHIQSPLSNKTCCYGGNAQLCEAWCGSQPHINWNVPVWHYLIWRTIIQVCLLAGVINWCFTFEFYNSFSVSSLFCSFLFIFGSCSTFSTQFAFWHHVRDSCFYCLWVNEQKSPPTA